VVFAVTPRRRFILVCLLAGVSVAVLTWLLGSTIISAAQREVVSDVALIPAALAVALCSAWRATRSVLRLRLAWWLLAAAGLFWTLGELGWFYVHYISLDDAQPSIADVFYLLALPPAAASLVVFPPRQPSTSERVRTLLGSLVVGGAVLVISQVVSPLALPAEAGWPPLEWFVLTAYPIGDIIIASAALITLVRLGSQMRLHLSLIAAGIVCYSVADTLYSVGVADDSYAAGGVLDAGWLAGYVLFAVAAMAPEASVDRHLRIGGGADRLVGYSSLVVYLPLVAALVAAASVRQAPGLLVAGTGIIVLILFGIRQALLAVDNARLRHALQLRVSQLEESSTALRRLAMQNERIVHSVVDGVIGVDSAGRITFANDAAAAMLGRAREDLVGQAEASLLAAVAEEEPASPTDDSPTDLLVARALRTGTAVSSAVSEFARPDGASFPVELAVGPIVEGTRVVGAVVVFRDISGRRAVETMKNEFISVVSHELRTPLTSIRGSLGLIANGVGGQLTTRGRRMIDIALASSERLTRLINDMLDVERMETGSLTMDLRDLDVADVVHAVADQLRDVAAEHQIEIVADQVSGRVRADEDRIQQALINLLGNAIKFSPRQGRITITAQPREEDVIFGIADQGRGIPKDKIDRIFERFEQVDSSDSRHRGGTGLGLTISKNLVLLHGGALWVESELGHGSTFWFTLPRIRSERLSGPEETPVRVLPDQPVLTSGDRAAARKV
jgi:PAS domain S-box-containing protein